MNNSSQFREDKKLKAKQDQVVNHVIQAISSYSPEAFWE